MGWALFTTNTKQLFYFRAITNKLQSNFACSLFPFNPLLSTVYFSLAGKAFSKYKLNCEHKRDRIERVKGCRGDIGDRAAILTSCHGKIITQTHSAHEQT